MHRVVGQPVGVVAGGAPVQDGARGLVESHHLVGVGGGGVHPVQGGDDQHAVDAGQAVDGPYDAPRVHIHLDGLARAEVGDEQQPAAGIEARVVEAGAVTRQGDLLHRVERQRHLGRLAVPAGEEYADHDGDDSEDQAHGQGQQGAGAETTDHVRASLGRRRSGVGGPPLPVGGERRRDGRVVPYR